MSSYLLLRDNKQTGPYTLDELITKGLKPYDLIWIEGKSAGWRYPSEVSELIAYAPAVEEQPFDRFFKKPASSQQKSETTNTPTEIPEVKAEPVFVKPAPKEENIFNLPNRKVYVNFPAAVAKRSNGPEKPIVEKQPAAEKQNPPIRKEENKEFERYLPSEPVKAVQPIPEKKEADAPPVVEKFSTTVFNENEKTGNGNGNGHQYREYPRKKKTNGSLVFGIAAVCILLAGVGIGLFISYSNQKNNSSELDKLVKQIKEKEKAKQVIPVSNQVDQNTALQQNEVVSTDNTNLPQEANPNTTKQPTKKSLKKENSSNNGALVTQPADEEHKEENDAQISERNEQKDAANEAAIRNTREKINELINIENNSYKTGVLGGISNLQLTISNNSLYSLDEVEVEIRYLGPEKKVVRTTNIQFTDIGAGEQKTLSIPKSKRGVGIEYTIKRVSSKALGIAKVGL